MKPSFASLTRHVLDDQTDFYTGSLPSELIPTSDDFEAIWRLHPVDFHVITMHGRLVPTPRWQQAYGHDYHYTGRVNRALPVPELIQPISEWTDRTIYRGLNGVLINWYDGTLDHYIGRHRDSTKNMVESAPIVTISLGEQRVFRVRRWKGTDVRDFIVDTGSVVVMPYSTNRAWTHEVPKAAKYRGRRISITFRAFEG
ncbi:MAG: alpha-ketoglutarate-dependent dioxygenase AlkB [Planctomycetia bacterium]|nr:alpha-ketoglutarate-dependent dioxygenase AlkB [Planctomycetia bacterium]